MSAEVIDSLIRNPVESNLLKYAAGQNIFCPVCSYIMDWRKTVVVTIYGKPAGKTEERIAQQYVMCSGCWDKNSAKVQDGIAKAQAKLPAAGIRLEIVDGRDDRFNDFH